MGDIMNTKIAAVMSLWLPSNLWFRLYSRLNSIDLLTSYYQLMFLYAMCKIYMCTFISIHTLLIRSRFHLSINLFYFTFQYNFLDSHWVETSLRLSRYVNVKHTLGTSAAINEFLVKLYTFYLVSSGYFPCNGPQAASQFLGKQLLENFFPDHSSSKMARNESFFT